MTTTTAFSLRALIREVAEDSALADPGALAKEVAKRLPEEHVQDAYEEMPRHYVREVITSSRALRPQPRPFEDAPGGTVKAAPVGRSQKVQAIRDWWRSVLRQRLHVGPAGTDWELLGDANAEQLRFAAGERREMAASNLANAEKLEALAALLDEHGVATANELPDGVLASFFGGSW